MKYFAVITLLATIASRDENTFENLSDDFDDRLEVVLENIHKPKFGFRCDAETLSCDNTDETCVKWMDSEGSKRLTCQDCSGTERIFVDENYIEHTYSCPEDTSYLTEVLLTLVFYILIKLFIFKFMSWIGIAEWPKPDANNSYSYHWRYSLENVPKVSKFQAIVGFIMNYGTPGSGTHYTIWCSRE